jgi:hypothetical protein
MRAIASLGCEGAMRAFDSSKSPHVSPQQANAPIFSAATAGGIKTVQTVSSAAKTLPTTPARERQIAARAKGYCTNRAILNLLRCITDELLSSCCGSVAAHLKHAATRQPVSLGASQLLKPCFDNIVKLRPKASVSALRAAGASQLLKPASATSRSYGRRHRSWHHGHVHATHNARRRGQRPAHHDQVITIKHLRRTTSGAARNGQGATMKYLRRTTSAAANNCMSTTIIPPL